MPYYGKNNGLKKTQILKIHANLMLVHQSMQKFIIVHKTPKSVKIKIRHLSAKQKHQVFASLLLIAPGRWCFVVCNIFCVYFFPTRVTGNLLDFLTLKIRLALIWSILEVPQCNRELKVVQRIRIHVDYFVRDTELSIIHTSFIVSQLNAY